MKKMLLAVVMSAVMITTAEAATTVPGHRGPRVDKDNNGYPDAGVEVVGHYTSVYAYDYLGQWYWDLGDGRIYGNVGSIEALDAATLTVYDYVINYRADFGNNPYMDSGWIQNHITVTGFDATDGPRTYHYLIVHQTDVRYTGNPDFAVWGTWEYFGDIVAGEGNLVRPHRHVE